MTEPILELEFEKIARLKKELIEQRESLEAELSRQKAELDAQKAASQAELDAQKSEIERLKAELKKYQS